MTCFINGYVMILKRHLLIDSVENYIKKKYNNNKKFYCVMIKEDVEGTCRTTRTNLENSKSLKELKNCKDFLNGEPYHLLGLERLLQVFGEDFQVKCLIKCHE